MVLGRHTLIDMSDCESNALDSVSKIKRIMLEACKEANLTVVDFKFHKFEPIGLSGVCILAESHVAIHTWPEYKFVSVDAFTCGKKMDPTLVCKILANKLKSTNYKIREFERKTI